jgi:hypothetical protein
MSTTDEILVNAHRIRQLENDLYYAKSTINTLVWLGHQHVNRIEELETVEAERDSLLREVEFYKRTDAEAEIRRNDVYRLEDQLQDREFWINVRDFACFVIWCGLLLWVAYV